MVNARRIIVFLIVFFFLGLIKPLMSVNASECITTSVPSPIPHGTDVTFSADVSSFGRSGGYYYFKVACLVSKPDIIPVDPDIFSGGLTPTGNSVSFTVGSDSCALKSTDSSHYVELHWQESNFPPPNLLSDPFSQKLCTENYQVVGSDQMSCQISISPSFPGTNSTIVANVSVQGPDPLQLWVQNLPTLHRNVATGVTETKQISLGQFGMGNYGVWLQEPTFELGDFGKNICSADFSIASKEGQIPDAATLTNVCRTVSIDGGIRGQCEDCFKQGKTWTAIGCIGSSPSEGPAGFIPQLIKLGASLAGGIAFLLILFGGFQIITSAGNPERLNAGRELITSAIAGLLLIIFSIFLLKVIGVDILGIPGFG